MLIAAMNPCPCGYRGDPSRDCQCTVPQVERYMSKISGPLLDRIDIHLEVSSVPFSELASKQSGTSSAVLRNRVCAAREIQQQRFKQQATDQLEIWHGDTSTFWSDSPSVARQENDKVEPVDLYDIEGSWKFPSFLWGGVKWSLHFILSLLEPGSSITNDNTILCIRDRKDNQDLY